MLLIETYHVTISIGFVASYWRLDKLKSNGFKNLKYTCILIVFGMPRYSEEGGGGGNGTVLGPVAQRPQYVWKMIWCEKLWHLDLSNFANAICSF